MIEGLAAWSDFFTDERLVKLINAALENNRDLRAAVYNVEKARAQYNVNRANLLPSIAAAGSETARSSGVNTPQPSGGAQHTYSAQAALSSYELDFFGRVRNANEQALQAYFQTEAAQRSAQMTVITDTAQTWLALGAAKSQLKLAEETFKSQTESAKLIEKSYELGASSLIDVQQVRQSVATATAARVQAVRSVAQYRNALALLVGAAYDTALEPEGLETASVNRVSAISNVPSEVLLQRPDIASAEAQLKSANANIGVARAAFFPRITLTGFYGTSSSELSNLFDAGTKVWQFVPSVSLPIFAGGANVANLNAAKAQQKAALATYEGAIQKAFKDVADALATEGTVDEELKARKDLADAAAETYRLAQERYKSGADSYLSVLDSQRTNFSAQQGLISAQLARSARLVPLYKAMGGGSVIATPEKYMGTATDTAVSLGRSRRRRPGEPSPREINREQRFAQILHAAYVCFTKKGFHSTSMSDIAREAGVSVGHLYNFFESRDAIVEVFAQRELDKLREKNRFYRESNLSEEEICRQSVYELALTKLDKTAARLTFEILSESVVNPRIQRAVKTYDAAWHEILLPCYMKNGRLTREEAEARLDADLSLVDGLYFRVLGQESLDKERLAKKVADRIWRSMNGSAVA